MHRKFTHESMYSDETSEQLTLIGGPIWIYYGLHDNKIKKNSSFSENSILFLRLDLIPNPLGNNKRFGKCALSTNKHQPQ